MGFLADYDFQFRVCLSPHVLGEGRRRIRIRLRRINPLGAIFCGAKNRAPASCCRKTAAGAVSCSTFTSQNRFLLIIAINGLIKDLAMNKIVLIDENLCIPCEKCVKLYPKKILFIDKTTGKCKVTEMRRNATSERAANGSAQPRPLKFTDHQALCPLPYFPLCVPA